MLLSFGKVADAGELSTMVGRPAGQAHDGYRGA